MSNFFDSPLVREGLEEINELQQEVYGNLITFQNLPPEEQQEHIDKLSLLLQKQKIMYGRLSLSDDPQAIEMKETMKKSVSLMGFPSGTSIERLFEGMEKTIEQLKNLNKMWKFYINSWLQPIIYVSQTRSNFNPSKSTKRVFKTSWTSLQTIQISSNQNLF